MMIKGCGRISLLLPQLHLNAAREQTAARVSDVIIAGWGVVVPLSRLKWKIALHIFGEGLCCVTCLQKPPPPSLFIHVVQGLEGQLAPGLLFPAQTLWAHSFPSSSAGGAEYREWFVCFIPQPNICPQR